jgi:hypothetical protein
MTYMRLLDQHGGPLCPNSFDPAHPSHTLRNRVLDLFYEAAPKDADGELAEDMSKVYSAAAHGRLDDYMHLYRHEAGEIIGQPLLRVATWWWRCHVCGLTLPAQQVPR